MGRLWGFVDLEKDARIFLFPLHNHGFFLHKLKSFRYGGELGNGQLIGRLKGFCKKIYDTNATLIDTRKENNFVKYLFINNIYFTSFLYKHIKKHT